VCTLSCITLFVFAQNECHVLYAIHVIVVHIVCVTVIVFVCGDVVLCDGRGAASLWHGVLLLLYLTFLYFTI